MYTVVVSYVSGRQITLSGLTLDDVQKLAWGLFDPNVRQPVYALSVPGQTRLIATGSVEDLEIRPAVLLMERPKP